MKKSMLLVALLIIGLLFETADAQIHARVNVNIGLQPIWGPTGYDHAEYYYMPDIDAYYWLPRHQYIYLERGQWMFGASLPPRYHDFDIYSGYKVVVNDYKPYRHADMYRNKYSGYRGRHDQEIIRNSHDERYFEIKDHPEHDKWRGRGNGHDNRDNRNNRRGRHGDN